MSLSRTRTLAGDKQMPRAVTMKPAALIPMSMAFSLVQAYLADLPSAFNDSPAVWAYVSYAEQSVAVLSGSFNRTVFQAPHEGETTDPDLQEANTFLNTTNFIAYDEKFFEILGPNATVEHVQQLALQSHEAPCFNKDTKELYFVEWGPPGGENGIHTWQYLLDTKNNTLRKITTSPPTVNAHGCVYYDGAYHVVTDGSLNETAILVRVDPVTLEKKVLLNNYYQQPFMGFNDIEIDQDGNFWLTDSRSGWGRDLTTFTPPTNPTVYMVNGTTMRPRVVHMTTGNTNGVAISPNKDGKQTLYLPDTGASEQKPISRKNPYGDRTLVAYDIAAGGVLASPRLLNNPISYFYDGIRVSRNGWIFVGAGDGVDVIDPDTGLTLGTIRVGGEGVAVNIAFGEHELWIVGQGGVWHVSGVAERLDRDW